MLILNCLPQKIERNVSIMIEWLHTYASTYKFTCAHRLLTLFLAIRCIYAYRLIRMISFVILIYRSKQIILPPERLQHQWDLTRLTYLEMDTESRPQLSFGCLTVSTTGIKNLLNLFIRFLLIVNIFRTDKKKLVNIFRGLMFICDQDM